MSDRRVSTRDWPAGLNTRRRQRRQEARLVHAGRRATDPQPTPPAPVQAPPRTLADVVDDTYTWPELVALELWRQEDERP